MYLISKFIISQLHKYKISHQRLLLVSGPGLELSSFNDQVGTL